MVEISSQQVTGLLDTLELEPVESQINCLQRHSQYLIRFLRQHKHKGCPHSEQVVKRVVQRTIQLISSRCDQPLCDQAIVLANNVFNLDGQFLRRILESRTTLRNLRHYCMRFLMKYEVAQQADAETGEIGKLDFRLYSVVYLLAVFASHRPTNENERRAISYFLSMGLLRRFLGLRVEKHSKPEIFFLFSVVLVYASRPIQGNKHLSAVKQFMMVHLSNIGSGEKTAFNYLHCLRIVLTNAAISNQEIVRHHVVEFIVANIEKYLNESHLVYALDSLRILLIGQPASGRRCLSLGLLALLTNEYPRHRLLVARVLEKILPYISSENLLGLAKFLVGRLLKQVEEQETLRILTGLLHSLQPAGLLELFSSGFFDDLNSILMSNISQSTAGLAFSCLEMAISISRLKLPELYSMVLSKIYSLSVMGSDMPLPAFFEPFKSRFESVHYRC